MMWTDPVFWVEWAMLSVLLGVALLTSVTDWQERRVPNRYVLALLAAGVAGQGAMVGLGVVPVSAVAGVVTLGLAIGLGLSLLGFWAPGDAKLFWAVSVALPPTLYPAVPPWSLQAPAVALLANALVVYLGVVLVVPLWRAEETRVEGRTRAGVKEWLVAGAGMAGLLGWVLGLGGCLLRRPLSYVEALGALIIGYRLLHCGVPRAMWPGVLIPGVVGLLYLGLANGGLEVYLLVGGMAWVLEGAYLRVRAWHERAWVRMLPVGLLAAGVVPRGTLSAGELGEEEVVCRGGQPLTAAQVQRLQGLAGEGRLPDGDGVELEQALPFVPFIGVRALLTACSAGSLVAPLRVLVRWLTG